MGAVLFSAKTSRCESMQADWLTKMSADQYAKTRADNRRPSLEYLQSNDSDSSATGFSSNF
jgi:hypothetical protein